MNKNLFLYYQKTDIGTVGIAECGGSISHLLFESGSFLPDAQLLETKLVGEAFLQLNSYLAGKLKQFSLPLAPSGTPYMRNVWKILSTIPYGTTFTYKDIAASMGNSLASRAVGMANHRNPIPVFIPCHRVIGSDGSLTGYRGGLALKKNSSTSKQASGNPHSALS
ncbi:MAG: methylated-DNA--[protein]-cysteine S-methyltransferase [Chlorobiaceae bacterium]